MADLLSVANGVAAMLADYGATVEFAPDFELRGMKRRVIVVPVARIEKIASRGSKERVYKVSIGIVHHCKNIASETPRLLALSETIGDAALAGKVESCVCVGVVWEPVYAPEEMKAKSQFTSVLTLSYKEIG